MGIFSGIGQGIGQGLEHGYKTIANTIGSIFGQGGSSNVQPVENANSGKSAYYNDFWDKISDFLGIGSAGKQAEWNASETDRARVFDEYMTKLQNEFNATEAQKERDWQKELSDTAFTRAVADLQNAGLNPILATGAQASSGAGASASATNFVANALGANGVASGTGMSGLASLANTALNVYRAHRDNARFQSMSQALYKNNSSMKESVKQLDNASSLMNIATMLLTKGKVK